MMNAARGEEVIVEYLKALNMLGTRSGLQCARRCFHLTRFTGAGHSKWANIKHTKAKNFIVYNEGKTTKPELSDAFINFTEKRSDIAILLINQHVADQIRPLVDGFTNAFPAILEIPSKDHPYDPEKDSVLRRVRRLFGE